MSNTEICFFYPWLVVTSILVIAGFACTVMSLIRSARFRTSLRPTVGYAIVLAAAVFLHPIINWQLFHAAREQVIAQMLQEVGTPVYDIERKYGEPASRAYGIWGLRWRYRPGPWYVLMPWEEVVFDSLNFKIVKAYVDD